MTSDAAKSQIRLRVKLRPEIIIGPGKADILSGIRDTGSISAAGRRLGMSYKRTWQLVDAMNHEYREPLVATSTGGQHGGGATLTATGEKVLKAYERMLANTEKAIARDVGLLKKLLVAPAAATGS